MFIQRFCKLHKCIARIWERIPLILCGVVVNLCNLSTIDRNLGIAAKYNRQFEKHNGHKPNYNLCENNETCIDLLSGWFFSQCLLQVMRLSRYNKISCTTNNITCTLMIVILILAKINNGTYIVLCIPRYTYWLNLCN